MVATPIAQQILAAVSGLTHDLEAVRFGDPVTHVYNPLDYAGEIHREYVKRFAATKKEVLLLGMNPGPYGMAQTGVPFGEISAARDWMKLKGEIGKPRSEHPKRPILGFDCPRTEVSGERLWGLFRGRYKQARYFFKDHYVANYCPLVWMEASGRNRTPDKLPKAEMKRVHAACDEHLSIHISALSPKWVVGVGAYAEAKAKAVLKSMGSAGEGVQVGRILHPSPASPAANKGWAEAAQKELEEMGLW